VADQTSCLPPDPVRAAAVWAIISQFGSIESLTEVLSAMAKGKKKLEVIHLVCEETGDYNYTMRRKPGGEKLKLKKFSPRLRKHTVHVEKKK
jgi:large subunit ribosomal protein L33